MPLPSNTPGAMGRGRPALLLALYCCAAHVAGDAFGRSENAVAVLQDAGGAGASICAICLTGACSKCKMCLGIGKLGPCSACYGDTPGGVCLLNKRKANQHDCRSCWHVDDDGNPLKPQTQLRPTEFEPPVAMQPTDAPVPKALVEAEEAQLRADAAKEGDADPLAKQWTKVDDTAAFKISLRQSCQSCLAVWTGDVNGDKAARDKGVAQCYMCWAGGAAGPIMRAMEAYPTTFARTLSFSRAGEPLRFATLGGKRDSCGAPSSPASTQQPGGLLCEGPGSWVQRGLFSGGFHGWQKLCGKHLLCCTDLHSNPDMTQRFRPCDGKLLLPPAPRVRAALKGKRVALVGDSLMIQAFSAIMLFFKGASDSQPDFGTWPLGQKIARGERCPMPGARYLRCSRQTSKEECDAQPLAVSVHQKWSLYVTTIGRSRGLGLSALTAAMAANDVVVASVGLHMGSANQMDYAAQNVARQFKAFNAQPGKLALWRPVMSQHFATADGSGDFQKRSKCNSSLKSGGEVTGECVCKSRGTNSDKGWRNGIIEAALRAEGQCSSLLKGEFEAMLPRWDIHAKRHRQWKHVNVTGDEMDCTHWCQDGSLWEPLLDTMCRKVVNKFEQA